MDRQLWPGAFDDHGQVLEHSWKMDRERNMDLARVAIEAMREPTRGMVDSGVAFALCVTINRTYRWSDYVADKHRAMIDAALTASPASETDTNDEGSK